MGALLHILEDGFRHEACFVMGGMLESFATVQVDGHEFQYSPCLHITTFRVAEKYGSRVGKFRTPDMSKASVGNMSSLRRRAS